MILEVKALAIVISTVVAISGTTVGVTEYMASKVYVTERVAMNFEQMIEFRIQDFRARINQIKVRAAAGKPWLDDTEEKVRLQKELDRLINKKDK